MAQSSLYNYFESSYDDGESKVTTKETLKNAVGKGYLTETEYETITGEAYTTS